MYEPRYITYNLLCGTHVGFFIAAADIGWWGWLLFNLLGCRLGARWLSQFSLSFLQATEKVSQ